jgi:hypothetical protein
MATTTPNFGWPVPTSTDLVKDGATAIEGLGDAIDASLLDLKGGTTNQVLAKNSNTDMDFKWVADASGIPATIIDAKGDLIAGTAADTAARLAVGTNGQVLTADSTAATGLAWATAASGGGYTELASGSLSGTSVVLSTINSGYRDLQLIIKGATWGTGNSYLTLQANSVTANYDFAAALAANTFGGFVYASSAQSVWRFASDAPQTNNNDQNMYVVNFYDYAATNDTKLGSVSFRMDTGVARVYGGALGVAGVDAAISSLTISTNAGYTFNGGTYVLYGVK